MNRQRSRRSLGRVQRARRIRPIRDPGSPSRPDHRTAAGPAADDAVLALLAEILIGESDWTLAEVQRLISMRESSEFGRWRVSGLDDEGPNAG